MDGSHRDEYDGAGQGHIGWIILLSEKRVKVTQP